MTTCQVSRDIERHPARAGGIRNPLDGARKCLSVMLGSPDVRMTKRLVIGSGGFSKFP
jgi:hypothetical protein